MSITGKTGSQIRDLVLSFWASRYAALGKTLDTSIDSDAFQLADAFALIAEAIESRTTEMGKNVFPDTSDHDALIKHADLVSITPKLAAPAELDVTFTGTPGSSWATTDSLAAPDGTRYSPEAGGTLASSSQIARVKAQTDGASTTKNPGAILTWSSAPAGIFATAQVSSIATYGTDAEDDVSLAGRVLAWWQNRPGAGTASDYISWSLAASASVKDAFVYPLLHPTLGPGTLGAVTVCVVGPPGGRVLSTGAGSIVQTVSDYIKGQGAYSATGPKIPANIDPTDVTVIPVSTQSQDVTIGVTLSSAYSFSWTGSATTGTGSTTTSIVFSGALPAELSHAGPYLAVYDPGVSGQYTVGRVTSVNSGTHTVTLDTALSSAPGAGVAIYPAPANWAAIRDAALGVFNVLGPGPGVVPSERFPSESDGGAPSTLYQSAILGAVMGVPGLAGAPAATVGVRNATVDLGGVDRVTPAAKTLIVPGKILIVPA